MGISERKFQDTIGVSKSYINNIRNSIQPDKVDSITKHFPDLNPGWLLTGEGSMLRSQAYGSAANAAAGGTGVREPSGMRANPSSLRQERPQQGVHEPSRVRATPPGFGPRASAAEWYDEESAPPPPPEVVLVPLIGQYAYAGFLNGFADDEFLEVQPTVPFLAERLGKGRHVAIEVRGDSMDDGSSAAYLPGDILLCREVPQELWTDYKLHVRRWDFVVVTTEGLLLKQIVDHDPARRHITVHSLNPFYPDQTISLATVRALYHVLLVTRSRMR